ncbi:MAG: ATP-binding protein [Proteobacteria bacterium]|nr:ATP-binding protein [Pseudomonadota bacterium]
MKTENDKADTPADIYTCLTTSATLFLEETYKQVRTGYMDQLNRFSEIVIKPLQPEDESLKADKLLCQVWERLDESLNQMGDWAEFKNYPDMLLRIDKDCRKRMGQVILKFPALREVSFADDFFIKADDDTVSIRLFKWIKRLKLRLKRVLNLGLNVFRTNKESIGGESHTIHIQQFSTFHFSLPFFIFLSDFMNQMFHLIAEQFNTLHLMTQKYTSDLLILDKEASDWHMEIYNPIGERLKSVSIAIPDTEKMAEDMDALWQDTRVKFDTWKQSLEKEFIRKYAYVGTFVSPGGGYARFRFRRKLNSQLKAFRRHHALWSNHFSGERKDWTHEFSLNRIQLQVARKTVMTLGTISEKIDTQILPQCSHAIQTLFKTKERLLTLEKGQEWELKRNIIQESRTLLRNFRRELLPAIANKVLGSGIGQDINAISSLAKDSVERLAENHVVFKKRDDHIPPLSEIAEIPIREMIQAELLLKLQSLLEDFIQKLRIRLDDTVNYMSEIKQIVEFNIETSFNLLEKEDYAEDAFKMVIEGIERGANQLNRLSQRVEGFPQEIQSELGSIAYQWIDKIQELLDNEKLIALKLKLVKAKAKGRLRKGIKFVQKYFTALIQTCWSAGQKGFTLTRVKYIEIRSYLGLSVPEDDIQIQFTQFLLDTRQKLESLPFVYQQLFQIEPLTDDRLFYGREKELQLLKDDVTDYHKSGNMIAAVIGEKGSGKTTLLNLFKAELLKKQSVHSIELLHTIHNIEEVLPFFNALFPDNKMSSLDELEAFLVSRPSTTVFIVENIQNMFLKSMKGFDLMESFLGMMYRTRKQVIWICSCTLYSWEYLEKSIQLSKNFNRVIPLQPFTGEEIESMIFARHRITGYQLKFLVPSKMHANRSFKKLQSDKERQAYLIKLFFNQIQNVAAGNISVAILFWLRSIESIREHELQLSSQVEFNVKFLSQLSNEDLFTLGAIVQHDTLSAEDHAEIFRQNIRKSLLALNNLSNIGILQQTDGFYQVHPFLYRYTVRALKLQNILH